MGNVIYKDDEEYPSLLKKIGKDAPKQIYYKTLVISTEAKRKEKSLKDEYGEGISPVAAL